MIIPNQKRLFSIPEGVTYMNCANMAPFLRTVEEAGVRAIEQRRQPWTIGAEQWFEPAEELRMLFARIIGAEKDHVALIPSASYGLSIAQRNMSLRPGQTIVILDQQYPSNVYAWQELALSSGAVIHTVKRESGESWAEAIVRRIDEHTGLVAIPNCHWTDGSFIDLVQVGKKVKAVGAKLVIDASQSLGAYPLDVRKIQPDYVVTVGYKWLLGPYNLGYLYAAPACHEEGKPIEWSWMVKEGSDDFTRLVDYTERYKQGARRFDAGEFASFIHIPMARAALEQLLDWGVDNIQESLSVLTGAIVERARKMGLEVAPGGSVGHMVGIRIQPERIAGLQKKLVENKIYISFRGSNMRIAPHLYNDMEDVERLFGQMA
ncbi:MAG TPA: aminotransferase class V-fold PLP-dependent enzyme [Puia sp.]|nr:aminotransferase class V-fold PLP-dependent enzyme [Puia sp.]